MWLENKWIFFHCIKQWPSERGLYKCHQIEHILDVKIPPLNTDEYLVPICGYTPKSWIPFYLKQNLNNKVRVIVE